MLQGRQRRSGVWKATILVTLMSLTWNIGSSHNNDVVTSSSVQQNKFRPKIAVIATSSVRGGSDRGISTPARFACSAAAAVTATCMVHPLDVIRVRLQVDTGKVAAAAAGANAKKAQTMLSTAALIWRTGGLGGMYAGIQAGIARQLTYGMPRMAFFTMGMDWLSKGGEQTVTFAQKMLLGSMAGGVAASLGVPTEVSLVRMAADARIPDPAMRRNYGGIVDAIARIAREEGVGSLWTGTMTTVGRAMLLNAGQLAVYSEAKTRVNKYTGMEGLRLQFVSAFIGATAAVALSCPADVLKSRIQNAAVGEATGLMAVAGNLVKTEGVFAFWKGSAPMIIKLAPHSVISFIVLDNLTKYLTGKEAM